MEKIFQILAVFALMMLVVRRFIRGRESRFHPYDYIDRIKPPLATDLAQRLVPAVFALPEDRGRYPVEGGVDAFLLYETGGLVFCYNAEGRLTIFRQLPTEPIRQLQELAVPLNCTAIAFDPADEKLYFEAGGFLFVYGPR
jgi:hypothetical protein